MHALQIMAMRTIFGDWSNSINKKVLSTDIIFLITTISAISRSTGDEIF